MIKIDPENGRLAYEKSGKNISKLINPIRVCCCMLYVSWDLLSRGALLYTMTICCMPHIVPVARLEAFRALKYIGQVGGV